MERKAEGPDQTFSNSLPADARKGLNGCGPAGFRPVAKITGQTELICCARQGVRSLLRTDKQVGFPDDRDRQLIRQAERTEDLAIELANWVTEFNTERASRGLFHLRVRSSNSRSCTPRSSLYSSAKVPVAAAVYGPSQVGKSLFVGQVLMPSAEDYSPLGRDQQHGEPAYYQHLSFDADLNPQSGSNEATALVTRFTTKDRITVSGSPEYPVVVRALTRAQWLRLFLEAFPWSSSRPLSSGTPPNWKICLSN